MQTAYLTADQHQDIADSLNGAEAYDKACDYAKVGGSKWQWGPREVLFNLTGDFHQALSNRNLQDRFITEWEKVN